MLTSGRTLAYLYWQQLNVSPGSLGSQAERTAQSLSTLNLIWIMPAEGVVIPNFVSRPDGRLICYLRKGPHREGPVGGLK